MKLTFYGGTGNVTGANFLLEHEAEGKTFRALIDCGFLQGVEHADDFNRDAFPYKPEDIDAVLITHAHMDHIGRVPKLVKEGFRGAIYSTAPTHDMAELLFEDALQILDNEARKSGTLPLYDKFDAEKALSLWHSVDYHAPTDIGGGLTITLSDAGHILGSSMIAVTDGKIKAVFTGDLGNSPSLLLNDTEDIKHADYIIMESVYGDRNHESKDMRRAKLRDILRESIEQKRTLIIPAFSVERTQMLLYEMNEFFEKGELPQTPVFLDSPLAIKITKVYEKYTRYLNPAIRAQIKSGDDIFKFPKLRATPYAADSRKIELSPNPKIIIAGSGMSSGGRVIHHEKENVDNPNATILLVGYQALGTLGRQLEDGAKSVRIWNENHSVRCRIEKINGYSSHKDSDHLTDLIARATEDYKPKKVFTVMGEPKSSTFLAQRLQDEVEVDAVYPEYGSSYELK